MRTAWSRAPARARCTGPISVALVVVAIACRDTTAVVPEVTKILVDPGSVTLAALNDTVRLTARAIDQFGAAIVDQTFQWSSSNPQVVSVDATTGLATAVGNGTASVTAAAGRVSGTARATVAQSVNRFSATPDSASLEPGDTIRLHAGAWDANGHPVNLSITWSSLDTSIAKVDGAGLVTAAGRRLGLARTIAQSGSYSDTVSVSVLMSFAQIEPSAPYSFRFICGLGTRGRAYCWGGGLGFYGGMLAGETPVAVPGNISFAALTAGRFHACGLTSAGAAWCWGGNNWGQLGTGTTDSSTASVLVTGGLRFSGVAAGGTNTCGVAAGGALYCWGGNSDGQFGTGDTVSSLVPRLVTGAPAFATLTAGGSYACGLTPGGAAYCWGDNYYGELGDGTNTDRLAPVAVAGGLTFVSLDAGEEATCGVTPAGAAYCWGQRAIGDGTGAPRPAPAAVTGGLTFATVTTGAFHACGLTTAGKAYCWGNNAGGQLGDGTTTNRVSPVPVSGGLTFSRLSAGHSQTCGVTAVGTGYCWGDDSSVPRRVWGSR